MADVRKLNEFVVAHTSRGECQCGKCIDKGLDRPAPNHSVDLGFFWVAVRGEPQADQFKLLLAGHYPNLDRLKNGLSYIEIGAALGDQGLALLFIGLGDLLGVWRAVTPARLGITGMAGEGLAGQGLVMSGQW